MSSILDAKRNRSDRGRSPFEGAWAGRIAKTVTGPTQKVFVTISQFDKTLRWGPCRWMPRDAVTFPAKGDQALVVFDQNREPWVIAWWPF